MILKHFIATGAMAVATIAPAFAQDRWIVDPDQSRVSFTASQQDTEFTGSFGTFSAEILLDPDDPSTGRIEAEIDLASADAGNSERNDALPTKDWFNTRQHPAASFVSEEIVRTGEGAYEATGILTLKGVSRPVVLPFNLEVDGDIATARGSFELVRTDFSVGTGAYETGKWVGLPVMVTVEISARRSG